jgi:hypothetical protein
MTPGGVSPPRDLLDRMLRQSLRQADNLRAFLKAAVPELADGFDCARARLLDRGFPMEDWRRREADLPFEIPYHLSGVELPALVCVLLEHQADTDTLIPLRLLYFAVGYWDRQWQEWVRLAPPRPPLRLRPILPLVLYTGPRPWGSNRTIVDLLGEPAAFHAFAPVWQPVFWNLADQTPEGLLDSGEGWLQMMAVIRAQGEDAERFQAVFTEALRRLEPLPERDPVRWSELLNVILTWAANRRPLVEREPLMRAAEACQTSARGQQEVRAMTKTIAEGWMEEGMAKGQVLSAQTILRVLLEDRFGSLPEAVLHRITACTDLDRLQTAVRQVSRMQTLEELQL